MPSDFSAQSISVCNTANLTSSKTCAVFSTSFSHTHFDLYRDVPKYFIYVHVMLVTSDYLFVLCSFMYSGLSFNILFPIFVSLYFLVTHVSHLFL